MASALLVCYATIYDLGKKTKEETASLGTDPVSSSIPWFIIYYIILEEKRKYTFCCASNRLLIKSCGSL